MGGLALHFVGTHRVRVGPADPPGWTGAPLPIEDLPVALRSLQRPRSVTRPSAVSAGGTSRRFALMAGESVSAGIDARLWQFSLGREVSIRELWAELSATGAAPADADVEAQLSEIATPFLLRMATRPAATGGAGIGASALEAWEEDVFDPVDPDPRFGFGQAKFPWDPTSQDARHYGTWANTLADHAEAQLGTLRRMGEMNYVWEMLLASDDGEIGAKVPRPDEVLARVEAALLTDLRFPLFAFACFLHGIGFCPTLLTMGGGGPFDQAVGAENTSLFPQSFYDAAHTLRETALGGQNKPLTISTAGFDPFYWDPKSLAWGQVEVGAFNVEEQAYQRYAVNTWVPDTASAYMQECARRKALMVAAYAQGVGRAGARLAEFAKAQGLTFTDLIPYYEVGNELDVYFRRNVAEEGRYLEPGALVAHLTAPLLSECPDGRFRLFELSSLVGFDSSLESERDDWVSAVLSGVAGAIDEWQRVRRATLALSVTDWETTCGAGGLWWPPLSSSWRAPEVSQLVHQAGIHWYHCWSQGKYGNNEYFGQQYLADQLTGLGDALSDGGFDGVGLSVCEIGFPADWTHEDTPLDPSTGLHIGQYWHATPMLQAAMHTRSFLTALAVGAGAMMVWTWMAAPTPATAAGFAAQGFATQGARNDTQTGATFDAAVDAWPRPAWYALRRLVSLMRRTRAVTALRLNVPVGNEAPDDPVILELHPALRSYLVDGDRWPYAYVLWLDQSASVAEVTVSAWASAPFSYRMASLTPDVTAPTEDAVTLGSTGYPEPAALDWEWTGAEAAWDSGLKVTPFVIGAQTYVRLTVARSDPDTNPGLVILFTSERLLS